MFTVYPKHATAYVHALPNGVKLQDVENLVVGVAPVRGEDGTLARGARDEGVAIGTSGLKEGRGKVMGAKKEGFVP